MDFIIGLVLLANAARIDAGVPALRQSAVLNERAEARAELLCATGQWSHAGWIASFNKLKYSYAGENLARDFDGATSTHNALMNSPTHRANIVKKQYKEIGVGHADCNITVELFRG